MNIQSQTRTRIVQAAAVALLAAMPVVLAGGAWAATTKFKSCDDMHRAHPNGISKSKAAADLAVRSGMKRPKVMPTVYRDSYKTLDRDNDGTMCEVPN